MIKIKDADAIQKMSEAGKLLASILCDIAERIVPGASTFDLDAFIDNRIQMAGMVSQTKGYKGYNHSSCISLNDEVVHGVPSKTKILKEGDLVKVDVCASWKGYCADMARPFIVGTVKDSALQHMIDVAGQALDKGIQAACVGNRLFDMSSAIQTEVEAHGFGIVRDFSGHGIGATMHEYPDVPNYGRSGTGHRLAAGMAFAIEPMITKGSYRVFIGKDGWTVKTSDGSLAVHIEDTVVISDNGPLILTR
jgi:methionyl aminopeptidase